MQGFFFYSKSGTCLCGKQSIERHTRSDSNGNNHKRRGFYIIKKIQQGSISYKQTLPRFWSLPAILFSFLPYMDFRLPGISYACIIGNRRASSRHWFRALSGRALPESTGNASRGRGRRGCDPQCGISRIWNNCRLRCNNQCSTGTGDGKSALCSRRTYRIDLGNSINASVQEY